MICLLHREKADITVSVVLAAYCVVDHHRVLKCGDMHQVCEESVRCQREKEKMSPAVIFLRPVLLRSSSFQTGVRTSRSGSG